ncbi:hypothetical protein F4821DRAFT_259187 [Hypoxylon rubiginosum]|uniref:Uncharacterized protein n=1 Tax=Hypoxylon rubiginosum TaxID=110542 RepID=A0ACC0D3B8_9PEZI|nr:hypothetical protein F4821DRAFT_259187 [Hypoxylon rubiginosum]
MAEPKITSKNLAYASDLPPFLARLRGQQQQHRDSDSPDPILAARRRAAKPRSASEEAEDVPLVVDEEGNTIAFPGADADVATETEEGDGVEGRKGVELDKRKEKEREKVAGIGAGKKRKVGRIVGGDEDEGQTAATDRAKGEHLSTTKKSVADSGSKDAKPSTKQGKKKAKKIKLSFGDDGD